MAAGAIVAAILSMLAFAVFLGLIGYIFWDRGKVAIEYRDQKTGSVDVTKSRPKDEGIPFEEKGYPNHMLHVEKGHMGTWHGSVLPWSYPLITIDPHTGEQFASRRSGPDDDEFPTELTDDGELRAEPELLAVPWAHVYWELIDSEVVSEAIEAQKPAWAKMQGVLIVGMIVMSLAFLGSVYITSGGA